MRTLALPDAVEQWSLTSLREKLIKIGAKIVRHGRYVTFQMAVVRTPCAAPRSLRSTRKLATCAPFNCYWATRRWIARFDTSASSWKTLWRSRKLLKSSRYGPATWPALSCRSSMVFDAALWPAVAVIRTSRRIFVCVCQLGGLDLENDENYVRQCAAFGEFWRNPVWRH